MSFLRVSAEVLAGTRARIQQLTDELPQPLSDQVAGAVRHYVEEQVDRDPPRNIVTAIGYDSGLRDMDVLVEAGVATALGGMHSLVLDDFVDNKEKSGRPWHDLYVCHVLYVLHQQSLQRIHPEDWFPHGSRGTVGAQLATYNALLDEEINHVGRSCAYQTPRIVWEKCSPVKAVIERVLAAAGRRGDVECFFPACDLACFALCTLDDMIDWREDFDQRRFSYPIQSALTRLGIDWAEDGTADTRALVHAELCYGQTYHLLMKQVVDSLDDAIARVRRLAPSLAVLISASKAAAVESWTMHVQHLLDVEDSLSNGAGQRLVTP